MRSVGRFLPEAGKHRTQQLGAFCVLGSGLARRCLSCSAITDSWRWSGFSVMWSPDRGLSRQAEGSQVQRLWIDCTKAPMLRLREAEKLRQLEQG